MCQLFCQLVFVLIEYSLSIHFLCIHLYIITLLSISETYIWILQKLSIQESFPDVQYAQ